MSELDSRYVKRGLWVDLSKGPVMGKTITTDTRTGSFVIALLAILSSLATAHLWHLVTFLIHQFRADGRARDALFRQQQAILRTLPTPGALMTDSFKLYWQWKEKEGRWMAFTRVALLALLASLFVASTWAASIFSSLVVDTSHLQVLVSSPFCGAINVTADTLNDIGLSYLTEIISVAEPFAEDCYVNKNSSLPALCDTLIRPKNLFTSENVTCPWDPTYCAGGDKPAIRMDSGLLNLNDFGLNLPAKDQVQFRKSTTCAVLPLENHTAIINASDFQELNRAALPQEELLLLFYGDVLHYEYWKSATFVWSLAEANVTTRFNTRVSVAAGSEEWYDWGTQIALPEMQRNDSDIVYRMIAKNYVMYREQNDDLVFSAHKNDSVITNMGQRSDKYYADFPVSVVACAHQYQYCVAQEKGQPICSELSALPPLPTKENFPKANDVQLTVLNLLVTSGAMFDQGSSRTFEASASNWDGEIISLPNNQWQNEVIRWEAIVWAGFHHMITDFAIGAKHRDPGADSYVIPPSTAGQKQLCQSQKMQKTGGFVNINFFALVFVSSVSFFIVVLDISLLKFLIFVSEFRRLTGLSRRLGRWTQDGVLQLQRRAYESQGAGLWVNLDDEVPMTMQKERLEDLPVEWVPLTRVFVRYKKSKSSRERQESDEEFTPKPLPSAKTWATQDTIVSLGEDSLKKSTFDESKFQDSDKK